MAMKFQTVPHGDLGGGIDALSSEDTIPEGFSESLINMDPTPEGYAQKRPGYQGVWGNLPVRVQRAAQVPSPGVTYPGDTNAVTRVVGSPNVPAILVGDGSSTLSALVASFNSFYSSPVPLAYSGSPGPVLPLGYQLTVPQEDVTLQLDSSIDLPLTGHAIQVAGLTSQQNSSGGGEFPQGTYTTRWYPSFLSDPRYTFSASSTPLVLSIPQVQSALTTVDTWVGLTRSTSTTDTSNQQFIANAVGVNSSTLETDISYETSAEFRGFVYYASKPATLNETYIFTATVSGSYTASISAATHALSTSAIQVRCFYNTGTALMQLVPDSIQIDASDNVSVSFIDLPASTSLVISLSAAPEANSTSYPVGPFATVTQSVATATPFTFMDAYTDDGTGNRAYVLPDSVSYDATTGLTTVSVTNASGTSLYIDLYWQTVQVVTNVVAVYPSTVTGLSWSDSSPQLTIWGLDHSSIYGNTAGATAGWVTELDSYRADAEEFLVAGLGGNFFKGANSDIPTPQLYPNLQNRASSDNYLGPVFVNSLSTSNRSAGYIQATNANGFVPASSIVWDSSTGWMLVTIELLAPTIVGTLSSIIRNTAGFADQLTIQGASYSVQDGTFPVEQVSLVGTTLQIWVSNPALTTADYQDAQSGARVGVFTDRIAFANTSTFLPGDALTGKAFTSPELLSVLASSGTEVLVANVTEPLLIPGGSPIAGQRTSSVIPLRDSNGVARVSIADSAGNLVDGMVAGDMANLATLSGTGNAYARNIRVTNVVSVGNQAVSLSSDGEVATAILSIDLNTSFQIGDQIALSQAGVFTGTQVITALTGTSGIEFASTQVVASQDGTLIGYAVGIDESLQWSDDVDSANTFDVAGRWAPIEAPTTTGSGATPETPGPYVSYLPTSSYSAQPIMRSTMVSDLLLLNNGVDRTLKVDGSSVYRAGLPRWQPNVFIKANTADPASGSIPLNLPSCSLVYYTELPVGGTPAAWNESHFYVAQADVSTFAVGTRVQLMTGTSTDASIYYTVTNTDTIQTTVSGTSTQVGVIYVDQAIKGTSATSGTAYTLQQAATYSYYFRLNAVDKNQNVIASAATGSEDFTVTLAGPAAVRIRLVGLPAWDIYDYDALEVQVYRTKVNGVAPYYLIGTYPLPFAPHTGYLDVVDTTPDVSLADLDPVNTGLKGSELGTTWSNPVRAKHVTSASNRLVLANITGDPTIDVTILNQHLGTPLLASELTTGTSLWQLDIDEGAPGSSTNMLSTARYQVVASGAVALSSISSAPEPVLVFDGSSAVTSVVTAWNTANPTNTVSFTGSGATVPSAQTVRLPSTATVTVGPNDFTASTNPSFTVTKSAHGLVAGDWVYLFRQAASSSLSLALYGWWQVHSSTTNAFTILWAGAPTGYTFTAANEVDSYVTATNPRDVPVWMGVNGSNQLADQGLQLNEVAFLTSSGGVTASELQNESLLCMLLANAVNCSMRMVDRTVAGQQTFKPWISANAGGEYDIGQIVFVQPMNQPTVAQLTIPSGYAETAFKIYIANIYQAPGSSLGTIENRMASRLLVSYPNFAEIFDNPFSTVDSQSDSAIDVNPSDGQEITAVIPFFGESTFGAAMKDAVILVFKTNSIYLVNVAQKAAGANPVQRLETMGLGCTAPYSVTPVRGGVMFANESGIYKIQQDMSIWYMGRRLQNLWRSSVDLTRLDLCFGHNFSSHSFYRLSTPMVQSGPNALGPTYSDTNGNPEPTNCFVYNSTREYSMQGITSTIQLYSTKEGSWSQHQGVPGSSVGWCNLDYNSYMAATYGRVFQLRQNGDSSDWRDDDQPIAMTATLRAMDFGDAGVRKDVPYVQVSYRNPVGLGTRTGTAILTATDMATEFTPADSTTIANNAQTSGLGDTTNQKVVTYRYSILNKRCLRMQVQITNATKDEPVEITQLKYTVAGLTFKGIREAASGPTPAQNGGT